MDCQSGLVKKDAQADPKESSKDEWKLSSVFFLNLDQDPLDPDNDPELVPWIELAWICSTSFGMSSDAEAKNGGKSCTETASVPSPARANPCSHWPKV